MTERPPCPDPSIQGQALAIESAGGRRLGGRLFLPPGAAGGAGRCVVLAPALAAPQRYLRHLAAWLAASGFSVLSFDYSGVGESLAAADARTNLDDWGDDLAAALAAARARLAPRRLLVLGHSLGGMLLGHAGLAAPPDAALIVAGSQGLPRLYRGRARLRLELAYRLLPRVARAFGRLPGSRLLLAHALPRDVVVQWARWGREGFVRWGGAPSAPGFLAIRGPLIGVGIEDDDYAPLPAVDALLAHYRAARVRRERLAPAPGARIGHFGAFAADPPQGARERLLSWLQELRA